MPSYGWCHLCLDRTGHKAFRELSGDRCADCIRRFGSPDFKDSTPQKKLRTRSKNSKPKSPKPSKPKSLTKHRKKELSISADEESLLNWLKSQQIERVYWKSSASKDLGWEMDKVGKVAKQIRYKKLWNFSRIGLLEKISNCLDRPKTAYELADEIDFNRAWISQVLRDLAKEGKVTIVKPNHTTKPYTYLVNSVNCQPPSTTHY